MRYYKLSDIIKYLNTKDDITYAICELTESNLESEGILGIEDTLPEGSDCSLFNKDY